MNMKKFHKIYILLSCTALVCCTRVTPLPEKDQSIDQQEQKMVPVTFTATYPQMEGSKTAIGADGSVTWHAGDEISIYYLDNAVPVTLNAKAASDGATVHFTAYIPENANPEGFFAAYPAGSGLLSPDGRFSICTASEQDGTFAKASFAAAYAPMGEQLNLHFKNCVGLYKIKLPTQGQIQHGGKTYTISKVSITDKKVKVPCGGKVAVNISEGRIESFSAPTDSVFQTSAAIGSDAIQNGYAYIQSTAAKYPNGIVIRFDATDGSPIPAVATTDDKEVSIAASHIKPIEAAFENIVWDWYFSTDGTGNGKSISSPAGTKAFVEMLNSAETDYRMWMLDGAVLHLSDGTYDLDTQINITGETPGTIHIQGQSASQTIIDGTTLGGAATRVCPVKSSAAADLKIESLTIANGLTSSSGGAIYFNGTGKLILESCIFTGNSSSSGNSGALYLGGYNGHEISNCEFTGNSASTYGGAFSIGGSATGLTKVENCKFTKNKTTYIEDTKRGFGGAIYVANADITAIDGCIFDANSANINGGAIYGNKAGSSIYINKSLFVGNTITKSGYAAYGAAIMIGRNTAKLGIFNSTFNYNHSSSASSATNAVSADHYVIGNCTFVESAAVSYGVITNYATEDHQSTLVNNIVITTSSNANHSAISCAGDAQYNHLDSRGNLVTRIQTTFTAASDDATSCTGATKASFGFADSVDKTNKCYKWDGDLSAFPSYNKCTREQIESIIGENTSLGADFLGWLRSLKDQQGNDALSTDVRGVLRNSPFWPGSYQD